MFFSDIYPHFKHVVDFLESLLSFLASSFWVSVYKQLLSQTKEEDASSQV